MKLPRAMFRSAGFRLWWGFGILAWWGGGWGVGWAADGAERPNVIFLAVDDMNDWVGWQGARPRAITPHLDRLAEEGVRFINAHTAGTYCAPSRSAIFTGQFASTTGCYQNQVYFFDHPELRPLQVSFQEAGYETLGAGKLFHHPAGYLDQRGWTEFFVRTERQRREGWPLDSWSEETPIPQPYPNSMYNRGGTATNGAFLEWGRVPAGREEEMADTIRATWAAARLREPREKPFFLALGLYAPHFPNYCPAEYFDLYDRDQIPLPPYKADDLDDLPEKIRKEKTNRSRIQQKLERLGAVEDAIHGYLACMSYADAMMGRVLEALRSGPHAGNTVVVFWSDHGYHHGEKGHWGKHTLWERTSNVPFLWAGAGIARGQAIETTVSLIDIYPTLVEWCGLPDPGHALEGMSLAPVLRDPASARDRDVFLPYVDPDAYAVINQDWRYIRYADQTEELYDLRVDPHEWFNLAGKPDQEGTKARLRASAPTVFADPGTKFNRRKNLRFENERFYWSIP